MKNLSSWALALVLVLPAAAPAAEESSASRVASSQADNFPSLDVRDLIARVAKRTGKQFIVDPRVRADVPLTGLDVMPWTTAGCWRSSASTSSSRSSRVASSECCRTQSRGNCRSRSPANSREGAAMTKSFR